MKICLIVFNSIFRLDDYSDNIVLIDNDLEENQLLRANQLIQHTNVNIEKIIQILGNSAENWTVSRIGKAERSALILGISELLLNLTPHKVIAAEWTKIVDKHSSSEPESVFIFLTSLTSSSMDV